MWGHQMSCMVRKPVLMFSNQVRQKTGCTAKEDGEMLKISNLRRGNVLCSENKGAYAKSRFSHSMAHILKTGILMIGVIGLHIQQKKI